MVDFDTVYGFTRSYFGVVDENGLLPYLQQRCNCFGRTAPSNLI